LETVTHDDKLNLTGRLIMKKGRLTGAFLLAGTIYILALAIASPVVALDKIQVCVSDNTVTNGPFAIANKMGYYKAEEIAADFTTMPGGICERATLAGSIDFAITPNIFEAFVNRPLGKIILVGTPRLDHRLIAHPSIKSIADLKGKMIAVSSFGGLTDVIAREILIQAGLRPDKDVTLIVIGTAPGRLAALMSGSVQASLFSSLFAFKALDAGYSNLKFPTIPYISIPIGVTNKTLKERPDLVIRFTRATVKGYAFFREKREQALPILKEWTGLKTTEETIRAYDAVLENLGKDGTMTDEAVNEIMNRSLKMLNLKAPVPAEQVFDFSILRKINSELKNSGWKP
jgi:ABC-type nitrate/sulfonate/bicarbonate transport system substrate-binding protein